MATEKRDLRSGQSVWQEPRPIGRDLTRDLETEVLVIGSGVTGVLLAERLSHHFSVVLVDERGAARGSTPASTGLLLFEIDTPLIELRRKIGEDKAARAWRRSHHAMIELLATIERLGIRCGMERCSSIYLPGETLDADGLRTEAAARIECGLPSRWVDRGGLRSLCPVQGDAAIVSGNSAKVDPVRFSLGFLSHAVAHGADVYRHVYVSDIRADRSGIVASTKDGPTIAAKFAVFATGYELPKYLSLPGKEVASTWVMATVAQELAPEIHASLVWEADDPYHYVRTTSDGRVIVGGQDEEFDDEEKRRQLTAEKTEQLQERLGELFPQLDTRVEYAWSGAFGRSETGLPSIGAIPGKPNCFAVVGFGGNGMTYAMIGAQLIERMLLGRADPDADLYAFSGT